MSTSPREKIDSKFDLTFERLLLPFRVGEFLGTHWGKSPLVLKRHDREYYRSLLSLADVDACLMTAANRPSNILHVIAREGSRRSTTLTPVTGVSMDRLYEAYHSGDTIRLFGVEKIWPPLGVLAASMCEALDAEINANLFLTPPHSQAFSLHFDSMDAFIVQLAGSKRWRVWEQTYERPLSSPISQRRILSVMETDEAKLTLREDLLLRAGDIMYLPRGFYHEARAVDELSLHLTIGSQPLSWLDFLKRALDLAALDDVELRRDLPPGFVGSRQVQQSMPLTFTRLLSRLGEQVSFDATLRSIIDEQVAARTSPPDGHFAALASLLEIGPDSLVERRRGLVCLVERSGDAASIKFGPVRVQGPASIEGALEFIRDHRRFRACDLPDSMSLDGRVTLIRRLIREGLLSPASEANRI